MGLARQVSTGIVRCAHAGVDRHFPQGAAGINPDSYVELPIRKVPFCVYGLRDKVKESACRQTPAGRLTDDSHGT